MATRNPEPVGGMAGDGAWTTTTWIPQIGNELQASADRIERELRLQDQAADDGSVNQPPKTDTMLNKPQAEVCQRIFGGILMLNAFLHEQIDAALGRARSMLKAGLGDLDAIKREVEAEVDKVFADHRVPLREARLADLRTSRGLRKFRHDNNLRRDAHYKESTTLVFAILLALLLGESILNGALLSGVMQGGLLEGSAIAVMISGLNILLGVCAGLYGWRLIGHRKPALKALGALIAGVAHGFAIAWNIFVAHFREVAEAMAASSEINVTRLGAETIRHFNQHGILGLSSVQSWALLLLGVFIHFYAAKEGWDDVADRYFDYKKYDARAVAARNEFSDRLEVLRADARRAVEQVEERVKSAASHASRNAEAIAGLADIAIQRRQDVRNSEDQWVAAGTRLLKTYRDKNVEIRDENSAPAYFGVYPSAKDYRDRSFGGLPSSDEVVSKYRDIDGQIAEIETLSAEAARIKAGADDIVRKAVRHANLTISKLDERVTREEAAATEESIRRLNEGDFDEPANDRSVGEAAA